MPGPGRQRALINAGGKDMEFHGIRTSGIALNDAVAAILKTKSRRSERYIKDLRLKLAKFSGDFATQKLGNIGQGDQELAKKTRSLRLDIAFLRLTNPILASYELSSCGGRKVVPLSYDCHSSSSACTPEIQRQAKRLLART
jgi:hypothetical protein